MKIVVIDFGIVVWTAYCRLIVKGDEIIVFERNASKGRIPFCLANAKIAPMKYLYSR
ncbi:hypothetical protein [uncultured Aquimarina sp.]|uniref:hypothetical protein n=1 Tax=uncultured Aquimarina sp. TaxID=575652 RepID=UPI00261F879C|nr:hypothetical protein [uncultured Aquimarina sp.]